MLLYNPGRETLVGVLGFASYVGFIVRFGNRSRFCIGLACVFTFLEMPWPLALLLSVGAWLLAIVLPDMRHRRRSNCTRPGLS